MESQIDSVSMQGSQHIPTPERKPSLTRSQTDSNITYVVEEIQEAPGSLHYITKDGDIDFQVVLKVNYLFYSVNLHQRFPKNATGVDFTDNRTTAKFST